MGEMINFLQASSDAQNKVILIMYIWNSEDDL